MGAHYTTDPRGLLPGERLQSSTQEEMWIHKSSSLYPRSGDLLLEGRTKHARAASPSFSSRSVQKEPILKGGLVQEISLIFYDTKVMKDDFPAPFCDLPDHRFVQWVVRNMELLGVGAWEAECEAMDVLWRTQEKRTKKMLRKEMEKKKNVENDTVEEDGQRASVIENEYKDTHEIVEMRLRLAHRAPSAAVYEAVRRGMPFMPRMCCTKKVMLKPMNWSQKWILPSRSSRKWPVIFGHQ